MGNRHVSNALSRTAIGDRQGQLENHFFNTLGSHLARIWRPWKHGNTQVIKYCPLQRLPAELLLCIVAYLEPVSFLSLGCTGQFFSRLLDVSINDLLGCPSGRLNRSGSVYWNSGPQGSQRSDRLQVLLMLERDASEKGTKAVCSFCASMHDKSYFSPESIKEPGVKHGCLGATGRLWLCPHVQLSYHAVSTSSVHGRDLGPCDKCRSQVYCSDDNSRSSVGFPILDVTDPQNATENSVKKALKQFSAPICSHLTLNDPKIRRWFSQSSQHIVQSWKTATTPSCSCRRCRMSHTSPISRIISCERCGAEISFYIQETAHNSYILCVEISRLFRLHHNMTSQSWLHCVTQPSSFGSLEKQWITALNRSAPLKRIDDGRPHHLFYPWSRDVF